MSEGIDRSFTVKESTIDNLYSYDSFLKIPYNLLELKEFSLPIILWLSFMLTKQEYFKKEGTVDSDGYFYYSQARLEKKIPSITQGMQTEIIKFLRGEYIESARDHTGRVLKNKEGKPMKEKKYGIGILLVKNNVGNPARNYYKIDYPALFEYIEKKRSSTQVTKDLEPRKPKDILDSNKEIVNNEFSSSKEKILKEEKYASPSKQDSETSFSPINSSRRLSLPNHDAVKVAQSLPKEKPQKIYQVSDIAKEIISYWSNSGLTKHRLDTKTAELISYHLNQLSRGSFFDKIEGFEKYRGRKFPKEDILSAIKNFTLAATSPDYEPLQGSYKDYLRNLSLDAFLFNPYSKNGNRSLFLYHLENMPQLAKVSARPIEDKNPELTNAWKYFFTTNALGGVEPLQWDEKTLNQFKMATNRTIEFWDNGGKKLNDHFRGKGMLSFTRLAIFDCFLDQLRKKEKESWKNVTPGWFLTDNFWNVTLPKFLTDQACFEQSWMPTVSQKPYDWNVIN